jgi:hypothetical protein
MALTPWQQNILNQSRANGGQGTVQEMVQLAGLSYTPENFDRVRKILADAGETATSDTIAENQARLAREATAAGTGKALTPYQQAVYSVAKNKNLTASDVAQSFSAAGVPVKGSEVNDILAAAGLNLGGQPPFTGPATKPTAPATTPQPPEFPGGMAGRQPDGAGMYGGYTINLSGLNTPGDQVPRHPMLRDVFRQARRRASGSYNGKTDTILTSGRGVLGAALLKRKVLTGS